MNKTLATILRILVSVAIISFLIYKVGARQIYETMSGINPAYILVYILTAFISLALAAYKLKIVADVIQKIPFSKMLRYALLSYSTGLFVPGRLGEFIIIKFLKDEGIELPKGTAITLLDKAIIFTTLTVVVVAGFFIFPLGKELAKVARSAVEVVVLLLVISVIILFSMRFIIKKFFRKYAEKFAGFATTLVYYLRKQKKRVALNYLLTLLKWIITAVGLSALFLGLGQHVSVLNALIVLSIGAIATLIPITFSGIGVRESIAVLLFLQLGVAKEITVAAYAIMLIINYITAAISFVALKWGK